MTSDDFVPFVPGTRRDTRRNQAALALLQSGATEVVVLEEPIDSYKRNGRSYASKNASAKLANFKKNAVKAGFNVHAFTRPSSVTGDPVAIEGVVQVLGVPLTTDVKEFAEDVKEAAKVEAKAAKRGPGRPSPKGRKVGETRTGREIADAAVRRYLERGRVHTTVSSWPTSANRLDVETTLKRANAKAQQVRDALKRAGLSGVGVRVRQNPSSVAVYIFNK